jgi:hypothetical protein
MESDTLLREQLRTLLEGGQAHMTFEEAVADFPREYMNAKPPHMSATPWHLLEHMRMAQRDILEFIRNPQYVSPQWPEGFWPAESRLADEASWEQTLASFRADREALQQLVVDPGMDLYAPIPHGSGQSLLREILLVADHTAFHLGEFGILRQVMQTWRTQR